MTSSLGPPCWPGDVVLLTYIFFSLVVVVVVEEMMTEILLFYRLFFSFVAPVPARVTDAGKQARSVENLCPAGVPLTMPSGDRPFLCGLQVGQPQCPQLFDCIVQPGPSVRPSVRLFYFYFPPISLVMQLILIDFYSKLMN